MPFKGAQTLARFHIPQLDGLVVADQFVGGSKQPNRQQIELLAFTAVKFYCFDWLIFVAANPCNRFLEYKPVFPNKSDSNLSHLTIRSPHRKYK